MNTIRQFREYRQTRTSTARALTAVLLTMGTVAVATSPARAQSGGPYDLSWSTVDSGGGKSSSATYDVHGTVGQGDAGDLSGDTFSIRGGFWQAAGGGGASCTDAPDCNDANACTYDGCEAGTCSNTPRPYGDIDGNGTLNLFDIFCILDLVGGEPVDSECNAVNADIEPCEPNGTLNLFDIFSVLDAIGGEDPCCSAAAAAPATRERELSNRRRDAVARPAIELEPSARSISPGETIAVEVLVSDAADLRGYEVALDAVGRRRGRLELESITVDRGRRDYVFADREVFDVGDLSGARVVAAMARGGVTPRDAGYLATFVFRASEDAHGSFKIAVREAGDTILLDSVGSILRTRSITNASVSVR